MARKSPLDRAVCKELDDRGIEYTLDFTRRHHAVYFHVKGQRLVYFYPSTPTCPRSRANTIAAIRRLIRQAETTASERSTAAQDRC